MTLPETLRAPGPIRVLIVDDHPVVREGLAMHIASQPDMEVCGEAEGSTDALALAESTRPDVAVIDISLKIGNGLDLVKRMKAHDDRLGIVIWSMYPENLYAERALRAGALGYVHKGRATKQIVEAIRTVQAGKVYLSEEMSVRLLSRVVGDSHQDVRSPIDTLSDRELEAFQHMGHGLTTEEIAERMHVSPKTIETYRARIKEKLGLNNVNELIHRASQWVLENG